MKGYDKHYQEVKITPAGKKEMHNQAKKLLKEYFQPKTSKILLVAQVSKIRPNKQIIAVTKRQTKLSFINRGLPLQKFVNSSLEKIIQITEVLRNFILYLFAKREKI